MGMIFIKNEKDSTSCYYSYKVNKFQQSNILVYILAPIVGYVTLCFV